MNKKELVKAMAKKCEMTQKDSNNALNVLIEIIGDVLIDGDSVKIAKFGKFETITRNAHKGRNPKTGEEIDIPEKIVPKFRSSNVLKELIQN